MKSEAASVEEYLDHLPLDLLGESIGMIPVDEFVARYQSSRGSRK